MNIHLLQLCMKRIYSNQPLAVEAHPLTHIYSNGCRRAVSRHANGGVCDSAVCWEASGDSCVSALSHYQGHHHKL